MSNGFKFNVQEAIDNMENAVGVDIIQGALTMFAVICINEDHASSHGGRVSAVVAGSPSESTVGKAIDKAVAEAIDTNESAPEGHTCKYVPVGIGLHASLLPDISRQLFRLPGVDEVPDDLLGN
jgi:hypothetical protein